MHLGSWGLFDFLQGHLRHWGPDVRTFASATLLAPWRRRRKHFYWDRTLLHIYVGCRCLCSLRLSPPTTSYTAPFKRAIEWASFSLYWSVKTVKKRFSDMICCLWVGIEFKYHTWPEFHTHTNECHLDRNYKGCCNILDPQTGGKGEKRWQDLKLYEEKVVFNRRCRSRSTQIQCTTI